MSKPEVLMIGPYPQWDMEDLETRYTIHKLWLAEDKDAFIAEHADRIRAIATRAELGASADLMQTLPKLEIVSCYGVGTDAINLGFARNNAIRVTNTPDVLTDDVADLGMALMLAAARQLLSGDVYVRDGSWAGANMQLTTRVCGKRVGIVGMGRIGAAFARRAAGFDCAISYFTRSPKPDLPYTFVGDPVALARQSDFLVITLAGGEDTRGIVSREVIEALGPDGILVNISRGTTVDEAALLEALEQKKIRGAGLDVFLNEPRIDPTFAALRNTVLQPHHGSGTVETRQAMGKLVRDNLAAHFAGAPLLTPVA
ncbi:2-hydroxyacid dehydrogenase [Pararhizobium sp.]|uniref:2-hydroxyacid dehydrogenase n=1 Tax=Pararhizobium sp. TaxID=1977563 RepID=UPI00272244BE|nr:2-hydroxyacid dehydrogenase [Pararhizobium sp.]MDO9416111.1 2-hydroxyacid dehydrogenase [Pararhizobium sp.]